MQRAARQPRSIDVILGPVLPQSRRAVLALALSALLAAGCAASAAAPPESSALRQSYERAVRAAAIYEEGSVRPLRVPPRGEKVRVVLWTRHGYELGPTELRVDVWVTLDGEVRSRCREFDGDLDVRLLQLLGLPFPDGEADEKRPPRRFVELLVPREELFRPCPNPSIELEQCGSELPDHATDRHGRWFAEHLLASQQVPGGYPFTRLGYTYDWKQGADRYGASEFLVRRCASVEVVAIKETRAYCAPGR